MNQQLPTTISPRLAFFAKAGLVTFGVVFGLLMSELALKLLRPTKSGSEFNSLSDLRQAMLKGEQDKPKGPLTLNAIINPHPHDNIIYDLRPNLDVIFERAPVHTNSHGMRGKEAAIAKPEGTYRIALLGDSFAFGWGVTEDKSFASVLEDELNLKAKSPQKFEVLNFGTPGYSTFQEVAKFEETGLDFDPDAVIVYFVDNDFGYPFFVRDVASPGGGGILSGSQFAKLTNAAVDPQVEEERVRLMGLGPDKALRDLSELCRKRGIRLIVAINPRKLSKWDYNRLTVLSERQDIIAPDLREDLLQYIKIHNVDPKDLTLTWDPHPSELKHKLLGQFLSIYFLDVLE